MELEFLLPFIDEIKRIGQAYGKKITVCTALDRFYHSDLFDHNVLSIVKEFTEIKYDIQIFNAGRKVITAVEYDFAGRFEFKRAERIGFVVRVANRITIHIKNARDETVMCHTPYMILNMLNGDKGICGVRGDRTDRMCRKFLKMLLQ